MRAFCWMRWREKCLEGDGLPSVKRSGWKIYSISPIRFTLPPCHVEHGLIADSGASICGHERAREHMPAGGQYQREDIEQLEHSIGCLSHVIRHEHLPTHCVHNTKYTAFSLCTHWPSHGIAEHKITAIPYCIVTLQCAQVKCEHNCYPTSWYKFLPQTEALRRWVKCIMCCEWTEGHLA